MFKKTHFTLLFSLLLHVVIIMLLNHSQTRGIPNTSKAPTPIKSYIYQTSILSSVADSHIISPPKKPKDVNNIKPLLPTKDKSYSQTKVSPTTNKTAKQSIEIRNEKSKENRNNIVKSNEPKKTSASQQTFSYKALQQLREKIQQQTNDQFERELAQPNSGSIMHGTPSLVPHSTVAQSIEAKKKQATLTMSVGKSIVKGDDGTCLLVENLSVVGIEGVTAVSSFACGETKFNKSFREHMNKVRKKVGKR